MKILNAVAPTSKVWAKKAKCGPIEGGPPVPGCGSQVELAISDVFYSEMRMGNMVGRSFHWMCPQCHIVNVFPFAELPTHDVSSRQEYLEKERRRTIIEIARLHPLIERTDIVEGISEELLLDETTTDRIIKDRELYQ